ncbi:hypothetical protein ACPPVU_20150 [Mucilaginibacter sp. McL0603]|uniref:hypothetical protein n=1 Tax=Mucilaginibacter sp. McL0603 TaxID=3415670 RepID=UPI003CF8B618
MLSFSTISGQQLYQPRIIIGVTYAMFFLPYSGTSIPAYIIALLFLVVNLAHLRFKAIDAVILSVILVWFILKCQQSSLASAVTLLRYYFGFYIFYLFFNNLSFKLNFEKLLFWISVVVIIEAFLINTILPPNLLPNYPKNEMVEDAFKTQILGFYQRPYSIGTNSSITSTILVLLLFCIEEYKQKSGLKIPRKLLAIATFAVVILGSGVGYILYLLYLIYRINPFKNILRTIISISAVLVVYVLLFVVDIGAAGGLDKISNVYMSFLFDFKAAQIDDTLTAFKSDVSFWLIGQKFDDPKDLIIWSDFAWENLFYCTGLIGFITTIIIFVVKTNRFNLIPLIIFALGAIHYGAMYSLPGQLLLGYLFAKSYTNFVKEYVKKNSRKSALRVIEA